MALAPTIYEYYTKDGITAGLSDQQPYFTLNDKNITIYSGAFHYFRVPRPYWRDRLRKMRAAGLNTVETYVPWNLHEPESGVYDFGRGGSEFEDFLHLEEFLKTAQEEDLLALVRPGPYICSEWEFGGFPSWILRDIQSVRNSNDAKYLSYVKRYFNILLPILALLQFQKGGPVIGFQIENEYGNTGYEDLGYLKALQKMFLDHGISELLYTSDPPTANGRGAIPGVLQTANFADDPKGQLDILNSLQSNKPTMAMEFYTGWFDRWTEHTHQTFPADIFKSRLEELLDYPSSVNHYMFVGSTNFGFLNGANSLYSGSSNNSGFQPDTTSYDYDSPITEYGGYTEKYRVIKDVIAARNTVITRNPDPPAGPIVISYPQIQVTVHKPLIELLDNPDVVIKSEQLLPMELLPINGGSGQSYGYISYRIIIKRIYFNSFLKIQGYVRDTVLVLLNGELLTPVPKNENDLENFGFWKLYNSTLLLEKWADEEDVKIDIVVENFGRSSYESLDQFRPFKGLTDAVYLNDKKLTGWKIAPFEFKRGWNNALDNWHPISQTYSNPALYKFVLKIEDEPNDTYLDMRNWTKGITIVNGFVLGRHFFLGPQQSLYLPAPFLKQGENIIVVFEHFDAPEALKFSDHPIFGPPSN